MWRNEPQAQHVTCFDVMALVAKKAAQMTNKVPLNFNTKNFFRPAMSWFIRFVKMVGVMRVIGVMSCFVSSVCQLLLLPLPMSRTVLPTTIYRA